MNLEFRSVLKNRKIIIMFLSIIMLISMIVFSVNLFSLSFAQKDYTLQDAKTKGYDVIENQLVSTTDDSQVEFSSPHLFLSSLQIFLDKPLEQDSLVTIYYDTGKGYSESEKVNIPLKKGALQTDLMIINNSANNFRIDLGDKPGEIFSVSKITANGDSNVISSYKFKYIIKSLAKSLLVLLVSIIVILLLIKTDFKKLVITIIEALNRFKIYFFTRKILSRLAGGIIVIIFGLTIQFITGYFSLNTFNDKVDFKIDNSNVISSDIKLVNENIVTQNQQSIMTINLQNKFIKDLAVRIENGRGTPLQVKINGQLVERKNYWDPYLQATNFNQIPVVYYVNQNAVTVEIVSQNAGVVISEISVINHYSFDFPRGIFLAGVFLVLYCLYITIRNKIVKVEIVFLIISLIIGSIFAFTLPIKTLINWDDEIHYIRSAQLLNSDSSYLSNNEKGFYDRIFPSTYSLSEREMLDSFLQTNNESSAVKSNSNVNYYSQIGYLPSAIVLFLGRIFKIPYNITFILGRWINVLIFSIVTYFAIKKLKSGKIIMALIALFPTTIFLSANYNYDSWVICFTMLGLAYLFSELQQPNKRITTKECIIMIGAFIIGLGPKAIYFPLMFLLFLLKPSKFENRTKYKYYKWATIISIVLVVSSFLLPFVFVGSGANDMRGGSDVNSIGQIKFILSSPVEYLIILFNFIKNYISLENMTTFVSLLAYIGSAPNFLLLLIIFVIALFTDKNDYDIYISTFKTRASVAFVYFSTVVLICTSLYVSFTDVGSATIAGVQGRYLIPLVFPLMVVFGSPKIKNNIKEEVYVLGMLALPAYVLFQTIFELCIKLYY